MSTVSFTAADRQANLLGMQRRQREVEGPRQGRAGHTSASVSPHGSNNNAIRTAGPAIQNHRVDATIWQCGDASGQEAPRSYPCGIARLHAGVAAPGPPPRKQWCVPLLTEGCLQGGPMYKICRPLGTENGRPAQRRARQSPARCRVMFGSSRDASQAGDSDPTPTGRLLLPHLVAGHNPRFPIGQRSRQS